MGDANGQTIVTFANTKLKTKVGTGECFDLADQALKNAGVKSAEDFGSVAPGFDYVWGKAVLATAAQPGDILQFRDHVQGRTIEINVDVSMPDGSGLTYFSSTFSEIGRPHHTAIVTGAAIGGKVAILEQNVDRGTGTPEMLVDKGEIIVSAPAPVTTTVKQKVSIDTTWGTKVKASYSEAKDKLFIDDVVRKNFGKIADETVVTTITVNTGGTIKAFRPQTK